MWKWIWPRVGPTPSSQNTDSEMFDRSDYPYTETFVREAIQNTLDARLDYSAPAIIRFGFHEGDVGARLPFLQQSVSHRKTAGFPEIEEWNSGVFNWVTIEDFNTRGLDGALDDRLGNFWNYWLNFGVSNKEGAKRGGRGIGRVTFLIASRMQTVLALTRRDADKITAACGMTLLRTMRTDDGVVKTTHSYLAAEPDDDVFMLHRSDDFHKGFVEAFKLSGYTFPPHLSGLALVIPYPHSDLVPDGILAASIEHFAPAILNGSLVVEVNSTRLDAATIDDVALAVVSNMHAPAIRADVPRFLSLVRAAMTTAYELKVNAKDRDALAALRDTTVVKTMQEACAKGDDVSVRICFDLHKDKYTFPVSLCAVIRKTPDEALPIDRLFREGMSLPEVKATAPSELDAILLADDEELATFLNLCEGKAHLDLLESKEVRAKLEQKGYHFPINIKRFVKGLPGELRTLLTPDITEPETDVFDAFFALPDDSPEKRKSKGGRPDAPPPPPPPIPVPRTPAILVKTLDDGFRLTANPEYTDWPVNVSVSMAYADGTRKPSWSEYDFRLSDLSKDIMDCKVEIAKNKITARECGPALRVEVTGFDARREVDTNIKVWKHAQND